MPTAVVTGPTAGIGNSFAHALAARGHDLVLVSRDESALEALAADLADTFDVGVEVLPADLADRQALARVEERLSARDHPVDLLVNNAGFALGTGFRQSTVADEDRLLDVHVRAVLRLTKAVLPVMISRGFGRVVNVASVAAFAPYGTYGAAKAWVTSFTETVASEVADTGVRVVACCPGFVRTEFHDRAGIGVSGTKLWSFAWLRADEVVATTLRRLDGRSPLIIPTTRYRLVAAAARHAPRRLVAAVARRVSRTSRRQ